MINNEYFMRLALNEAEAAFKENEVPVGAILVKNNKIISTAHNRAESLNDPTMHAELAVIKEGAVKLSGWRLSDATLYVTKEPCLMCAGAMVNARLGKLVYGCKDERYGAVSSRYQVVNDPAFNHEVKVTSGIMEKECADILRKFFVKLRADVCDKD